MDRAKISSYIGFAIKSRAVVFGIDAIERVRRIDLILVENTAAERTKKQASLKAEALNAPIIMVEGLAELVHRDNVKVIGIKDVGLARQIAKCLTAQ